jgi:calcium-translocating P-type ATPase
VKLLGSQTHVGLTAAEVAERIARDGRNVLPVAPPVPLWRQLGNQFVHFFAIMLWIAGALAIVAGLPQLGIAIFAVIVLNGVFAFAQEHRAERAAERLLDLLPHRVTVVRDSESIEIDATELVVDDLVLLTAGDRISADLLVTEAHQLRLDRSTLTGESAAVATEAGEVAAAGTYVIEGEGVATVTATGVRTRLAGIAALTQSAHREPTPLARELHRVVRTIAFIATGFGAGFFVLALLIGTSASDGFLFGIGVMVALVPTGLLPTVTLSLAIGAQRMARRHALVRRLEAVETLGSTTFVCTDKTGTLTENHMTATAAWTLAGWVDLDDTQNDALRACTRAAARCSSVRAVLCDGGWNTQGEPMETALFALALATGFDPNVDAREHPERRRFPFDARRRRMTVVAGETALVKGAPDAILPLCAERTAAGDALATMTGRGLRVLAIAHRPVEGALPETAADAERDLHLLGLIGLEDPPRAHAGAAVAACRRAGMKVAMVTGDHPATASAIAREVGLWQKGAPVLEGRDLPDDDEVLGALIDHDGCVLARIEPEQKLRIARALRARGHTVAMTGDGVNDGPALQAADIGIAMGSSGTDVAREAADLVLLDDDFATIVSAIDFGRSTFANVRRFLTYHLTDNVAELTPFVIWALSGGRFPLALGVLQLLALDVGTDTLPAVALGADPPGKHALDRPPARGHLLDRTVARRAFGVLGPTEAAIAMAAFVATFVGAGWRPGDTFPEGATLAAASGAAFTAIVLGQAANAFACRSRSLPVWRVPVRTNPLLLVAIAVELLLLAASLWIPALANLLDQAPPSAAGWAVALTAPIAVLGTDALDKAVRHRRANGHQPDSKSGILTS